MATAIPRIADEFGALNKVGWYGAAYVMTMCATQLPFGKLYSLYPVKMVFLCSISVFEIGSIVCGAAPSSNALIAGRAVAGVGAAGVFQGAMVIIPYIVPVRSRPACKWQQLFVGVSSLFFCFFFPFLVLGREDLVEESSDIPVDTAC